MSFLPSGSTTNAAASSSGVEVTDPPSDSISSLAFSSAADFLAVGSWNNEVRLYEVNAQGQTQGRAVYTHQAAVLGLCWNKEGNKVISCGADNAARMYDLTTGQSGQLGQQIAQHDAPIKCVRWIDSQGGILVTGSWDKTLKYWDLRQQAPAITVNLPERCYTMDVQYPLMVVGCAERHIQIFNLSNPGTPFRTQQSPLKWQTRVVSCFPGTDGYAIGSVEGRVAIHYIDDAKQQSNFSFKCHRKDQLPAKDKTLVYSVNDINFHPVHGTFSTSGSDGSINFWDKDAKQRLKTFDTVGPVTASGWNRTGTIFAYSVSYDWAKGHAGMTPGHPNKVMLLPVKDDDVKKKKR